MRTITLRNGSEIPQVGLGTWHLTGREQLQQIITAAFTEGCRLIDTAAAYSNEIAISKAIREAGLFRSELLLSSKVWNTSRGFRAVRDACRTSLKKLKTDYLDIYLIHWPASMKLYPDWEQINAETWQGMESLLQDGLVRTIGVCNFKIHHLEALKKTARILPFVDQIEFHPGMNQQALYNYCRQNEIQIEASSPLGNGQILENQELRKIAERKGKTAAQVCLRWEIQKDLIVIPKTSRAERLRENLDIYNFELTETEMETIDKIPYCGGIGIDPDEVIEYG